MIYGLLWVHMDLNDSPIPKTTTILPFPVFSYGPLIANFPSSQVRTEPWYGEHHNFDLSNCCSRFLQPISQASTRPTNFHTTTFTQSDYNPVVHLLESMVFGGTKVRNHMGGTQVTPDTGQSLDVRSNGSTGLTWTQNGFLCGEELPQTMFKIVGCCQQLPRITIETPIILRIETRIYKDII